MKKGEEKYIKKFDEWNDFKKILDQININIPFFEREIWSIAIGVNMDVEIDGKGENFERPAIVIKGFNAHHAWIVPLTSTIKIKSNVHVSIHHEKLDYQSVAIVTQFQRASNKRFLRRIGILNKEDFFAIIKAIKNTLPL